MGAVATAVGLIGLGAAMGKGDKLLLLVPMVMAPVAWRCFQHMIHDGAVARSLKASEKRDDSPMIDVSPASDSAVPGNSLTYTNPGRPGGAQDFRF